MKKILLIVMSLLSLNVLADSLTPDSGSTYELQDLVSRYEGQKLKDLKKDERFLRELRMVQEKYDLKDLMLKDGSYEWKVCNTICLEN